MNALCHMEGPARKTVCLVLPEPGSNLTSVEGLLAAALTIIISTDLRAETSQEKWDIPVLAEATPHFDCGSKKDKNISAIV